MSIEWPRESRRKLMVFVINQRTQIAAVSPPPSVDQNRILSAIICIIVMLFVRIT